MEADACLYATLIGVAGAAGDLQLAYSIQDEMTMDGLPPSKAHPLPLTVHLYVNCQCKYQIILGLDVSSAAHCSGHLSFKVSCEFSF